MITVIQGAIFGGSGWAGAPLAAAPTGASAGAGAGSGAPVVPGDVYLPPAGGAQGAGRTPFEIAREAYFGCARRVAEMKRVLDAAEVQKIAEGRRVKEKLLREFGSEDHPDYMRAIFRATRDSEAHRRHLDLEMQFAEVRKGLIPVSAELVRHLPVISAEDVRERHIYRGTLLRRILIDRLSEDGTANILTLWHGFFPATEWPVSCADFTNLENQAIAIELALGGCGLGSEIKEDERTDPVVIEAPVRPELTDVYRCNVRIGDNSSRVPFEALKGYAGVRILRPVK